MPNQMTFAEVDGYIVCYINGIEVSRAKKAADGTSTAEVIDIINDQIKANPTLEGTEPDLEGLEVSGDKYAVPQGGGGATLDDIVDSAGNKRFIEGNLNFVLPEVYPLTNVYSKWSLSGTHLMIVGVLANNTENSITIASNINIFELELPDYIMSKIIPINAGNGLVSNISGLDGNSVTIPFKLFKGNILAIRGITSGLSAGKQVRFQFDLLIDADYS